MKRIVFLNNMKSIVIFLLLTLPIIGNCQREKITCHFEKFETNTKASLRGLFVVNEKTIWASGTEGTVLLSTDGGENWQFISVPGEEENDFRSIHAWDENRALVIGINGPDFGYLTENGGKSWEVIFRDTTQGVFF